ncbi:MAG: sigma-54 interaction domain-containing protein [Gemmatimonadaceae bacterium]
MHTLTVVALSDSFAAAWPALAEGAGLGASVVGAPGEALAAPRGRGRVLVVAAGGREEALEGAVRALAGEELAAVGALPDHRLASTVVRAGAAEYFALPADLDQLAAWVRERADRLRALVRRSSFAEGEREKFRFDGIMGDSAALREALARAARIIPHRAVTVLLTGETGTGKELLARAIHYDGPRREAPFVDVNCAAIPEQLLESELFGHEKGAFTDASAAKPGLFELADGGTLLLDEIGHLALPLQGKLLRALEERAIRRVGGTRTIPVDVRIVAATHVNLLAEVRAGRFREDLYYRLNVVPIELPPLRARPGDVVPLARHFLARFASEYGIPAPRLTPAAERVLAARPWPGNVRELRNAVERALLLAAGDVIDAADVEPPASADAGGAVGGPAGLPFPAPLGDVIAAAARRTLELCGGNKSEAARRLRITRARLQRLLDSPDDPSLTDSTDDDV